MTITVYEIITKATTSRFRGEKHQGGGRGSCDFGLQILDFGLKNRGHCGFWIADCGMKNRR